MGMLTYVESTFPTGISWLINGFVDDTNTEKYVSVGVVARH